MIHARFTKFKTTRLLSCALMVHLYANSLVCDFFMHITANLHTHEHVPTDIKAIDRRRQNETPFINWCFKSFPVLSRSGNRYFFA